MPTSVAGRYGGWDLQEASLQLPPDQGRALSHEPVPSAGEKSAYCLLLVVTVPEADLGPPPRRVSGVDRATPYLVGRGAEGNRVKETPTTNSLSIPAHADMLHPSPSRWVYLRRDTTTIASYPGSRTPIHSPLIPSRLLWHLNLPFEAIPTERFAEGASLVSINRENSDFDDVTFRVFTERQNPTNINTTCYADLLLLRTDDVLRRERCPYTATLSGHDFSLLIDLEDLRAEHGMCSSPCGRGNLWVFACGMLMSRDRR